MALLVLDRSDLEVRVDGDALALYRDGCREGTVPLKLVDRAVMVGSSIRLDSGVLGKLGDAGITLLVLSGRAGKRLSLAHGPRHNDVEVRLAQARLALDGAAAAAWARRVVRLKVRRQRAAVDTLAGARPDLRKPLFDARRTLAHVGRRLHTEAATLPSLRGLEGAAAAAWFAAYTRAFPGELRFTGRNRRPPRDPVNAILSLAYTIATADAARACHIAGLDPMLGVYHQPDFGREGLACDLIEPLRPEIDLWVWSLFRDRTLRAENFSTGDEGCHLMKAGRSHFYAEYEAACDRWRKPLAAGAASLVHHLRAQPVGIAGEEAA